MTCENSYDLLHDVENTCKHYLGREIILKKLFAAMISAALVLSFAAGCGEKETTGTENNDKSTGNTSVAVSTADQSTAESSDEPTLGKTTFTVGFDAEFPPYGYQDDNGEYIGFDLDLADEVCKRNGWELVKKPIDWDSKDLELGSGTIDCIWNGFTINGREDDYTWTEAYVDNSQVFVVGADSGITAQADLAGKTVAVQADSSALAALTGDDATEENKALKDTFADLIEVADYNSAFMNLEAGAVDAIAMDVGVAKYQLASRGDSYVILDDVLAAEEYGVGFKLGNEELRDAVQKTMNEMADDGTFMKIAEKWELQDSVVLGK